MDITLLGVPRLPGSPEAPKYLERKTAALLAYLALEGPTMLWRLVGLLWPESSETTARSNLRQLLRRLRGMAGAPCVEVREPLRLTVGLSVDVALLRVAHETGDRERVSAFTGELLEGHVHDDCSALDEWLGMWWLRLRRMRFEALDAQVRHQEQEQGQLTVALEAARRLVDLEPTSEEAHQHVMRLLHRLGDRGAALAAWQQCREVLRRELDVEPSESTRQLARDIEWHEAGHRLPPRPGKRTVPLSVLHPPLLAGREREWELLEEAWAARRHIFVGETRASASRGCSATSRARRGAGCCWRRGRETSTSPTPRTRGACGRCWHSTRTCTWSPGCGASCRGWCRSWSRRPAWARPPRRTSHASTRRRAPSCARRPETWTASSSTTRTTTSTGTARSWACTSRRTSWRSRPAAASPSSSTRTGPSRTRRAGSGASSTAPSPPACWCASP
ncbi:bacterial transcriptional activator domain-containing protein [Pyxidicoccus parkwayensis]|uniref:Bacterial transcriptional activator domain-containing protein n=1 Tax=Pyxidicoccus parkwayensis TaxID=2813578 RepID=A0ABX7NSP4_9BACT|nr:bacterial transcriptional activator domain-containing protein [Pyxidicoccus parkwaysis]QSQ19178.1 bacterial transcriptional activator domain-containing protein [Pyxidicoccus parkwaysis]